MRYFLSTNASRPTTAGGHSFTFEPVALRGGTWLGILAVEDSLAAIISSVQPDQVAEIALDYYESLKKKESHSPAPSPNPSPTPSEGVRVVEPAAPSSSRRPAPEPPAKLLPVTLRTTTEQPPPEPLLASTSGRKKAW